MFGTSSFSQAPFASLVSGEDFALSLSENVGVSDFSTQISAYPQIISEQLTINEFNGTVGSFFSDIVESAHLADSNSVTTGFLATTTEAFLLDDIPIAGLILVDSLTEGSFAADNSLASAGTFGRLQ